MSHIFNGTYKLYLSHCVCNLTENILKMTVFLDEEPLQDFVYPSREQVNNCRVVHSDKKEEDKNEEKKEDKKEEDKKEVENNEEKAVIGRSVRPGVRVGLLRRPILRIGGVRNDNNRKYNKDNSLNIVFIMDINIPYDNNLDNDTGHKISIKFDHTEGSWKKDWLIDGVILEKIS